MATKPNPASEPKEVKAPRTRTVTKKVVEPVVDPVAAVEEPSTNGDAPVPLPKAGSGQISSADAQIEFDQWLWSNFIPEGAFMIMAGAGGVGKSSLIAHILSGVSNGTLEGEFYGQPQNSIWYSREDSTTVSLKPKLVAGEADERRIILMDQNGDKGAVTLTLPADLEKLEQDIVDNRYKVVVLDLLMSFVESKRSVHQNYGNVIQVFSKIAELCARKKVTVIGVMHNKPGTRDASAESVVSSIGIPGVARHLLMVGDLADTGLKVVGVVKSNVAKTMVGYVYQVSYVTVGRDPATGKPHQASKINILRPATKAEVAACLERPKGLSDATGQIKIILKKLKDGVERATRREFNGVEGVFTLVADDLNVKLRRFQDIMAEALAIGVIDERIVFDDAGKPQHLVKINQRGLLLVPDEEDELESEDDHDDDDETVFGGTPSTRQVAETIYPDKDDDES